MKLTLSEIGKVIKNEDSYKGDTSFYGVVSSVVKDGNKTIGYNVAVGDSVIEARKLAGAEVGDVVLCTTLNNGATVVTGALNGDKDAAEAKTDAATAKSDAATANLNATAASLDAAEALSQVNSKAPLTIIRQYQDGVLVGKTGNSVGALVNANGSFDVVNTTWSGTTPSAGIALASFGELVRVGAADGANIMIDSDSIAGMNGNKYFSIEASGTTRSGWVEKGIKTYNTSRTKVDLSTTTPFNTYSTGWSDIATGEQFKIVEVYKYGSSSSQVEETFTKGTATTSPSFPEETGWVDYDGGDCIMLNAMKPSGTWAYRIITLLRYETSDCPVYQFNDNAYASTGAYSFLTGEGTMSSYADQLVCGKYNKEISDALFIVGRGSSNTYRTNAFYVKDNGNSTISGDLAVAGSLTIGNHSSAVGDIITASPSESKASATDYVTLTSEYLSLPAGTWVITYSCYCDVNSAGKRLAARLYNRTSSTNYNSSRAIAHTQNTAAVCITGSIPLTVSTTTSIALQAYQNSGASRTISGYMRAVRIA